MRIILKYKFHILGVLILAGIGYFVLIHKVSQVPNLKAIIVSSGPETLTPTPDSEASQSYEFRFTDIPWEYSKEPVYLSFVFGGRRVIGRYIFKAEIIGGVNDNGTPFIKVRYLNKFEPITKSEDSNDFAVEDSEKNKYTLSYTGQAVFRYDEQSNEFTTTAPFPVYAEGWWRGSREPF